MTLNRAYDKFSFFLVGFGALVPIAIGIVAKKHSHQSTKTLNPTKVKEMLNEIMEICRIPIKHALPFNGLFPVGTNRHNGNWRFYGVFDIFDITHQFLWHLFFRCKLR
jgi:hypothetical protein